MLFTVFLRFAGLGPFVNLSVKDGITMTLRILSSMPSQNYVKASKITKVCTQNQPCSPAGLVDHVFIGSDEDIATFSVNIMESVEMLELELNTGGISRRVYIPTVLFSSTFLTENPSRHVLPTENGQGAVKMDVLCSYPLAPSVSSRIPPAKSSPSHEYFSKAQSLVFGHRGMGITYKYFFRKDANGKPVVNPFTENTIESFNAVAGVGGDGVEFDVVLTRDFVPILYHDFYVAIRAETPGGVRFVKIPIHSITYEELRSLQLYHTGVIAAVETRPDLAPEMFRIPPTGFPKLEEMLQKTSPKVALNLEVKYPQLNIKNEHECAGYHNRNIVADQILEVLAGYAGERPIIITSFDFDACLVFSSKQSHWPVAALTQGKTKNWPAFADARTRSTESSAQFAKNSNLWGISAHAEDFVADKSLLSYVRKTVNVSMLIWGEDVANPEVASSLMPKESGAAANIIITDDPAGVVKLCKQ